MTTKLIQTAIVSNPTEFRKNIVGKFQQQIQTYTEKEKEIQTYTTEKEKEKEKELQTEKEPKVGCNIEKSVYNYAIQEAKRRKIIKKWENPLFLQIYMDRLRSIYSNLTTILPHILSGEIHIQQLTGMTHQEMNPARWCILIDQKMKRDASKYTTNIEASTDMFTCRKCRSKKCTYYELQTRSADEPASIFVTCLDCGKHWKQC